MEHNINKINISVLKKIFPQENCKDINNLKYDKEGLWSISHPDSADTLTKNIIDFNLNIKTICDMTASIGGNTLSFAKCFENVISIECNKIRFQYLQNNINNYNYKNIILFNDDSTNLIKKLQYQIDAVFIDPPWGGPNYKKEDNLEIKLGSYKLDEIINILKNFSYKNNKIKLVIFKLPFNYDYHHTIIKNSFQNFKILKEGNINYLFINLHDNKKANMLSC